MTITIKVINEEKGNGHRAETESVMPSIREEADNFAGQAAELFTNMRSCSVHREKE